MTEKDDKLNQLPEFFNLLSNEDKEGYEKLRSALSSRNCRNRRNKRLETFNEMLNSVRTYAVRHDDNDWKRCLVCGVLWLSNGIAINTRQMRLLIDKCKSSINGSLHRMGYSAVTCRGDTSNQIVELIPMLKNNFSELRQWTVRQLNVYTPQPPLPKVEAFPMKVQSNSPAPQINFYQNPIASVSCPNYLDQSPSDTIYGQQDTDETLTHNDFYSDPFVLPLRSWIDNDVADKPPEDVADLFGDFTTDFNGF